MSVNQPIVVALVMSNRSTSYSDNISIIIADIVITFAIFKKKSLRLWLHAHSQ